MLRVEAAPGEVAHHDPAYLNTKILLHFANIALLVDAPDGRRLLPKLGANNLAHRIARVAVTGGGQDDIDVEPAAPSRTVPVLVEFLIGLPLLSLILPSTIILLAPTPMLEWDEGSRP